MARKQQHGLCKYITRKQNKNMNVGAVCRKSGTMSTPKKTLGGPSAKKAPPSRAKGDPVEKIPANQGKSSMKKAKMIGG
uniref:Uncharacterized protein n=1 Tax=Romanomermis culicivorax TaxID=13658 RepID=A0A915IDR5_ROMCU